MEGRWGGRPSGVRQGGRAGQGAPGGEERSTQLAKASLQEPGSASHCMRQKETDGKGGRQRWGQGAREKQGVLTPRPPWAEPSLADAWSWSIRGGGAPWKPYCSLSCPCRLLGSGAQRKESGQRMWHLQPPGPWLEGKVLGGWPTGWVCSLPAHSPRGGLSATYSSLCLLWTLKASVVAWDGLRLCSGEGPGIPTPSPGPVKESSPHVTPT